MHIGLIGGIGPAATDYYYRGLIRSLAESEHDLNLTIAHADSPALIRHQVSGDQGAQAEIFLRLIDRLAAAGAEEVAVTSIAGHFCIEQVIARSPLPVINLITIVRDALTSAGISKIGILGTRAASETGFYGGLSSFDIVMPGDAALDRVHQDYVDMATQGVVNDQQRQTFFDTGTAMIEEQGAETVLLGGTDLFLAFDSRAPGFPVFDCANIHMNAIAERARV